MLLLFYEDIKRVSIGHVSRDHVRPSSERPWATSRLYVLQENKCDLLTPSFHCRVTHPTEPKAGNSESDEVHGEEFGWSRAGHHCPGDDV